MNSPSITARLFRWFFRQPGMKRHYFGFYNRIFKPLNFFHNQEVISGYDENLKIRLRLHEWIQQQIYFFGYFDERGIRFLKQNLKQGDVFMDVGANIGCYTLIASKLVGTSGHVYAFEAIDAIGKQLTNNLEINGLKNVTTVMKAVYENSEKLKFFVSGDDNMGTSSILGHEGARAETVEVDAIALDEFVEEQIIKKVSLIKIDIEGAEYQALKGMRQLLLKFRPVILIEISDEVLVNSQYSARDIISFITGLSYDYKAIDENGMPVDPKQLTGDDYCNFAFFPLT